MNGHIIAGTDIAVDFWKVRNHPNIKHFFLTHLHGDHIVGLTSSWNRPIYCSSLTARLLEERYGLAKALLHPLEVGETHILYFGKNDLVKKCSRVGSLHFPNCFFSAETVPSSASCDHHIKKTVVLDDKKNAENHDCKLSCPAVTKGKSITEKQNCEASNSIVTKGLYLTNSFKTDSDEQLDNISLTCSQHLNCLNQISRDKSIHLCDCLKHNRIDSTETFSHHFQENSASNTPECKSSQHFQKIHTDMRSNQKAPNVCFGETVNVTVIDANHCPGAVMFLFEGAFGKILYTGDFRYHPSMVETGSLLAQHAGTIDRLYLDNTYCSPECVFPTREKALEEIIQIALEHSNSDILLGLRGLGKEELAASVALALGEWICVPPNMLNLASVLCLPNVFKSGCPDLRLRVVPFHTVSMKSMREWNETKHTIAILPTALFEGIGGKPFVNQQNVFVVPYSDHSSYPELIEFVCKLKPASVVPIVSGKSRGPFGVSISSRADMACFLKYLSPACNMGYSASRHLLQPSAGIVEDINYYPHCEQPHALKRRKSMQIPQCKTKAMCSKGVHYLSDSE